MASRKGGAKSAGKGTASGSRGGRSGGSSRGTARASSGGPGPVATLLLYGATIALGTGIGVAAYWQYGRVTPPKAASNAASNQSSTQARPGRPTAATRAPERPRRTEPAQPADDEIPRVQVRTVSPETRFENPDDEPPPLTGNAPTNAPAANGSAINAPAPDTAAVPQPLPPTEIRKGLSRRPEVALTFDAGSDWKPVRKILETLSAERVQSTFFLTGEWVTQNPKSSRRIATEGHELGNHSWDHPAFTKLSDDQIGDQLRRTEAAIQAVTGKSTFPYFRPPLGDRDPRVLRAIGNQGYFSVYWTLDSRDSVDKGITAAQIRDRVLAGVQPGSIVLMHCGSQASADALPEILAGLKAKGLKAVPVSRLLEK